MRLTGSVLLEGVPDVAVEVVVAAEQQPAALGERHGRDAADDVVVRVHADLLVGADVEKPARRVVGTGREREPARKELSIIVVVVNIIINIFILYWTGLILLNGFSFLVNFFLFYFGSCGRLSCLNCQLSSAR